MTKNERINELEHTLSKVHVELSDLRLLIARLATRVGYLELADQKQYTKPSFPWVSTTTVPQWTTVAREVTCKNTNPAKAFPLTITKVDSSAIPQSIVKFSSTNVSWPFPPSSSSPT